MSHSTSRPGRYIVLYDGQTGCQIVSYDGQTEWQIVPYDGQTRWQIVPYDGQTRWQIVPYDGQTRWQIVPYDGRTGGQVVPYDGRTGGQVVPYDGQTDEGVSRQQYPAPYQQSSYGNDVEYSNSYDEWAYLPQLHGQTGPSDLDVLQYEHGTSHNQSPAVEEKLNLASDYGIGHPHFDAIKQRWSYIPRHYVWMQSYSENEERKVLKRFESDLRTNLLEMDGEWHEIDSSYLPGVTGLYIVTITYNQDYTLLYVLLRENGRRSVVGINPNADGSHESVAVSRWDVIFKERPNSHNKVGFEPSIPTDNEWSRRIYEWLFAKFDSHQPYGLYYSADQDHQMSTPTQ